MPQVPAVRDERHASRVGRMIDRERGRERVDLIPDLLGPVDDGVLLEVDDGAAPLDSADGGLGVGHVESEVVESRRRCVIATKES